MQPAGKYNGKNGECQEGTQLLLSKQESQERESGIREKRVGIPASMNMVV